MKLFNVNWFYNISESFFGHVEPASEHDANCTCGCIWTLRATPGYAKWFLFAFCAFLFSCAFIFGTSRHTQFRSLFSSTHTRCARIGLLCSHPIPLFNYFSLSGISLWTHQKSHTNSLFCRLFLSTTFLRLSCWCHLLLAFCVLPSKRGPTEHPIKSAHTSHSEKCISTNTQKACSSPSRHPSVDACVRAICASDRSIRMQPVPTRRRPSRPPTTKCCLSKCAFYFAIKHHATHSRRQDALGKRANGRSIRFPHTTEEFHHTRPGPTRCVKRMRKQRKCRTHTSAKCAKMHCEPLKMGKHLQLHFLPRCTAMLCCCWSAA